MTTNRVPRTCFIVAAFAAVSLLNACDSNTSGRDPVCLGEECTPPPTCTDPAGCPPDPIKQALACDELVSRTECWSYDWDGGLYPLEVIDPRSIPCAVKVHPQGRLLRVKDAQSAYNQTFWIVKNDSGEMEAGYMIDADEIYPCRVRPTSP